MAYDPCTDYQMETISDFDISSLLTSDTILTRIRELLGKTQLLSRSFVSTLAKVRVTDGGTAAGSPVMNGSAASTIKIMQWNILAQGLCTGADNFVCVPPEALEWRLRRLLILEEILHVDPDVLCMQEVDHYSYFQQLLTKLGYAGKFFPKPSSPCLDFAGNNGPDGCAVFHKTSRLDLLQSDTIVLQQNQLDTNQVSIMCNFKCKQSGREFTVATTHLKAKSGYEALRLEQGRYLLKNLRQFSAGRAVLLCGDFNAVPSEAVIQHLSADDSGLSSAYRHLAQDGSTDAPYTSWKIRAGPSPDEPDRESCKTIDFIFYDKDNVCIEALLSIPSEAEIGPDRLPSRSYPSDHLSLAAVVSFV